MRTRLVTLCTALCAIALIAVAGWMAYRLVSERSWNEVMAGRNFTALRNGLEAAYRAPAPESGNVGKILANMYRGNQDIELIALWDKDGASCIMPARNAFLSPEKTGASKALPAIPYDPVFLTLHSSRIAVPGAEGSDTVTVLALYRILPRRTIAAVLKMALILLLALLVLALVLLLVISRRVAERAVLPGADGGEGVPDRERAELYSPASGLGWGKYLVERLDSELNRAASFEQDIVFMLITFTGLSPREASYRAFCDLLVEFFTFRDLMFERDESGFAVILPNIEGEKGLGMAREFSRKAASVFKDEYPIGVPLAVGLTSRAGRLVRATLLLKEAESALERAKGDGMGAVIAFKPDLDRYRSFISAKVQ